MGKIWHEKLRKLGITCAVALIAGFLTISVSFPKIDYRFNDLFLVNEKAVDNRIKIIGIDKKSLQEIGPFSEWTRKEAAKLLQTFDEESMPAVIAFDINYFGTRDEEGDQELTEAAKKMNRVVMASYLDFVVRLKNNEDGISYIDTLNINQIEEPYESLKNVSTQGFTNALQDADNYVRRSLLNVEWNEKTEYNFAYEIYRQYQLSQNKEIIQPKTNMKGVYGFDYTAQPGMYEVYSFTDVLQGKYDMRLFKDSIVLVGAYSSGMMDQYMVPIAKGTVMNGVEVQANHVNALLKDRTFSDIPSVYSFWLAFGILFLFILTALNFKYWISVGMCITESMIMLICNRVLYQKGYYWKCFNLFILLLFFFLIKNIAEYILEKKRRRGIMEMFCKYMEPKIVEQISKKKNFKIELGGYNRQVAVLFVDLRGFTTLSEHMPPDAVVGILNAFLSMVTEAVFHNEGMIDKFIGDCAMAIFNAPLDIDNYMQKAVQAGIEIVKGVQKINKGIKEQYHVEIACGVGIHCGNAIVGNIGSDYRMDYTAIGDTVNTAERLESIAKGGEIFVSEGIIEQIGNEFPNHFVEERVLKGKKDKIRIYCIEVTNETNII